MNVEAALAFHGVGKVFTGQGKNGDTTVFNGLDFTIAKGEFAVVIGPSGCGKSTLIDLVAGFSKPSWGAISAFGKPVRKPGPDRVIVFQDHAVFPWYTVVDNVAYGLRRQGVKRQMARRRAMEVLGRVGLKDSAHAYPAVLSGGMRQRVALARAIVLEPEILLLDEPFASLDSVTRAQLQDELAALWKSNGWTVVFITHSLSEAVYLGDRVFVLGHPPMGLRAIEAVGIERPRSRNSKRFNHCLSKLHRHMDGLFSGTSLYDNPRSIQGFET